MNRDVALHLKATIRIVYIPQRFHDRASQIETGLDTRLLNSDCAPTLAVQSALLLREVMLDARKARLKWNNYWFKTLLRWRSCSLICPTDRCHHRHVFWSWFGSCLAIAISAYLTLKTQSPLIMVPLGATSVLIFGVPDSPLAQPRNVIGGNVLSALVSLVILHLFGASPLAIGLAVSSAIALMQLTRTVHPPGGAVALVVMLTHADWQFLLTPTLAGSLFFVLCAVACNNLAEERTYPKHWL